MSSSEDRQSAAAIADHALLRLAALPNGSAPVIQALRREVAIEWRSVEGRVALDAAVRVIERGGAAGRVLGSELVRDHAAARSLVGARALERLWAGAASWGAVHVFSCYLLGPAWRDGRIDDAGVLRFAGSEDLHRWRAALVATVALNRRSLGGAPSGIHTRRTLRVCRLLIRDRADLVVKAMSWALRDLAKVDAPAVRAFLARHDSQLASRVRREVGARLAVR